MDDEKFLRKKFQIEMNEVLNLSEPKTFKEKLQWLKLYDRHNKYITMVDKQGAKAYVGELIGEEYIVPTIGIWDNFDDIDFCDLPESFVLKCTHDSGGLVIVRNKNHFDKDSAKRKIEKCMKRNYYWSGREWPYKGVTPQIIAEPFLENNTTRDLSDYKFFCFNGKVKCFKVDFDRFIEHHANYYDREKNILPFGEADYPPVYDRELKLPSTIDKMIQLAEVLSSNTSFLRVDFYDVDGKIYFGELTFYPASGMRPFTSKEWDKKLGDWISLNM